ncbi:hypothetical protein GCM10027187_44710 [Streptosporangium sandarakinum]|uniref:DUF4178 domain-containing protein n=2 Tax=Streptosporangium sandarakinum TaxID=1260955 RepID=A0A852V653_9ACTN|nr:hypothetical protein [Streptosporangium sandarakinum]
MISGAAVAVGLGVVALVLLAGVFVAAARRSGRRSARRSPAGTPPARAVPAGTAPPPTGAAPPSASPSGPEAGHAGVDHPDPRAIKVGDTIECQGARSRVMGALYLSWQGNQWTEYLLDDGSRRDRWLSIETRPGSDDALHLEVLLWTRVPTQGMIPAKTTLTVEGVEFFPVDRGTAAFRGEGVSMPERGLLDFADYRAADGRLLSFERLQGHRWRSFHAQPLPPGSITFHRRADLA